MNDMPSSFPRRIVVGGTSSTGKTTAARRLAALTGAPHIELDALHWEPNWTPADRDVFRSRVAAAIAAPSWVADGGYESIRDLTWGNADHMIWLDYSMPRILWQLTKRTFGRVVRREELWNGNRESVRNTLMSKDSLYVWVFRVHWQKRQTYPAQMAQFPRMTFRRVRSPRELELHINELSRLL